MTFQGKNYHSKTAKKILIMPVLNNWTKILFLLMLNIFVAQAPLSAEIKICEIKYNEKNLDNKNKANSLSRILQNQEKKECHLIGREFDRFGEEIPDKPIYACCKKSS